MIVRAGRSLQLDLIVRLVLFYSVLVLAVLVGLLFRAGETARTLTDHDLRHRAEQLGDFLVDDGNGQVRLRLPPEFREAYSSGTRIHLFAVEDAEGRLLFASHPEIADLVRGWPLPGEDPDFFMIEEFGPQRVEYYGLVEAVQTPVGRFNIMVAHARDINDLIWTIVAKFVSDIAWAVPLSILATIGICVWTIRGGVRPLLDLSEAAGRLSPRSLDMRLATAGVPDEVKPLVDAVNKALARLEEGFHIQRRFTAYAAHELRTPLAVLRARLQQSGGKVDRDKLSDDLRRMSRTVEQLLLMARIENLPAEGSEGADLCEVAGRVVADLAPLAIAGGREIALDIPEEPVIVAAEPEAVEGALRNLVDNAVKFTAPGTTVEVSVAAEGCVSVRDRGPGVAEANREKMFVPFWRDGRKGPAGTGLGLAIVVETARRFGGRVAVDDGPDGGAIFSLYLPLVAQPVIVP